MIFRTCLLFVLLLLVGGCAGHKAFTSGEEALSRGDYDEAVSQYFEAVESDPDRNEYRMKLTLARTKAAQEHLVRGLSHLEKENLAAAEKEFEQSFALDPSFTRAKQELKAVQKLRQQRERIAQAEQLFRARKYSRASENLKKILEVDPENPQALTLMKKIRKSRGTLVDGHELEVDSSQPITLKFKEADIRDVFKILSRLSGINFIFDEDTRSKRVTVFLEDATFSQSLQLLLKMNDLDKRVLNSNTIILFPKTREKQKQYHDQLIQVFYLSNIDAKKAVNMLRTMLQLRKIFVHDELNALVIRDSPDAIKLAEQILEAADRTDSEVVFELELIEVSHSNDLTLGARLSPYSVSAGLAKEGGSSIVNSALDSGTDTANLVSGLSDLKTFYTLPTATFNFAKTLGDSEILASPQIRVKNKGKAKVHIGSREPVITVTINGDQTSENVQYVDVGVKLDVEPVIQLDGGVTTKLNLEVSSVTGRQRSESTGTTVLTISTTNAQTELTLKDGEQTVIGGLIREEQSEDKNIVPLIGDLPLIGNLFTSHSKVKNKREILLSITPHIVKKVDLPSAGQASMWSGGEDDIKAGPTFATFAGDFEPDLNQPPPPLVPADTEEKAGAEETSGEKGTIPEAEAVVEEGQGEEAVAPVEPPAPPEAESPGPAAGSDAPQPQPAPGEEAVEEVTLPALEIPETPAETRLFFTGPDLVDEDEEVVLDARVAEVQGLYSAPLFVDYDPAVLEFVRAEESDFLKAEGQTTVFTVSADPEQGRLIVGYKQGVGGSGASGDGELFTLVFRPRKSGSASVEFERVNFRDREGQRLTVVSETKTVEIR
nr:hypothetical protein [Desulfuromonadales bacterium]